MIDYTYICPFCEYKACVNSDFENEPNYFYIYWCDVCGSYFNLIDNKVTGFTYQINIENKNLAFSNLFEEQSSQFKCLDDSSPPIILPYYSFISKTELNNYLLRIHNLLIFS